MATPLNPPQCPNCKGYKTAVHDHEIDVATGKAAETTLEWWAGTFGLLILGLGLLGAALTAPPRMEAVEVAVKAIGGLAATVLGFWVGRRALRKQRRQTAWNRTYRCEICGYRWA
jgi:hypothetical protein